MRKFLLSLMVLMTFGFYGFSQNEVVTDVIVERLQSCDLQFDLSDSWGDGWNDAALLVSFSDNSPSQSYTVPSGQDYAVFTLEVNSGTTVTLTWQPGRFDSECSFVVSYVDDGIEIYSVSEPSEGFLYEFVMDCSHPCPGVGDLTATAGGGGTMEISWTAPLGYVDNYDIYRDDEYIGSTSEPYYLDEGLEDGIYVYCVVTTFINGCIGQTECVEGVCSDPNTNSCNLQFDLFDSWGDGWNDAALIVSFSDGSPSQIYTLFSGSSAHYFLEVNSGTTVTLTWQPGGNDSECYFVVSYADNGIEIYSVSDPSSGFLYEFVMGPGVEDLTATAVGGGTMEISWTDPTGDIDHYDIYRDDVLIATTTSTSYTDEGLEDGIYVYCVVTTSIGGCVGQTECVEGVCADPNTNSCNLQFDLFDSYGDGWNDAALIVSFSDGSPSQIYTLFSGSSAHYFLEVNSGTTVTLTWQPGGNDSECYFVVSYADNGIEIYSVSDPSSGFLYEFVMGPGVEDLTATAVGGGTMEISWTDPTGDIDHYDIYRDDVLIATTTSTSYTDEGLEDGIYVYCVVTTSIGGCVGQTECVEGVCSDPITNSCNLQFDLYDSWGDGWDGDAALLVSFSDGSPSQSYTVSFDNDYASFTLEVNSGTTVTLTWQSGNNDSECSFVVSYADDGIEIFSVSDPSEGFLYEFVMDCSHPCPGVNNLTATAVGGGTMEISWMPPIGYVDNYDIYRDDEYIASTPPDFTYYTDEGLENGIYVYCVVPTFINGCVGQTECVEGVCSDPITNSCNLQFDLYDSWGDGWDGDAALLVSFSDGSPSQSYTVSFDNDYASFTLEVNSGTTVTLTWQSGNNDSECSFVVSYADDGIEIFSVSDPSEGFLYEFVMDCSHPCPGVNNLTATAVGGGTMEISWMPPLGYVDNYDIYRDNEYIASTPPDFTYYTDEGLEDGIYVYCVVPTFINGCVGQTECVEGVCNDISNIPGDADGDGVVNALDIVRLVNYIFGDPGDGFIFDNADINGDGVIDALDLVSIINLIFSEGYHYIMLTTNYQDVDDPSLDYGSITEMLNDPNVTNLHFDASLTTTPAPYVNEGNYPGVGADFTVFVIAAPVEYKSAKIYVENVYQPISFTIDPPVNDNNGIPYSSESTDNIKYRLFKRFNPGSFGFKVNKIELYKTE